MKVAHQTDYDTHAVIGGSEAKAFAISQTAEFFTVLSNTLYSNKPLAVVREVLCNAWDSHIASGVQHIPVNITIDADSMTIRDYGSGINPDMMHQIYCVYGASTKENDGLQTGGFGLGSKAPFAYSDHFTVTTHYKGIKTVYAISRGSGAAKGTPEMRAMIQVPTLEQGIEVKIPIQKSPDVSMFKEIIRHIAAYGEMNVVLNKEHIPIIPISSAEQNVFLCKTLPYNTNDLVHVRYGNVIYPVPDHEDYRHDLQKVVANISAIVGNRYHHSDANWYLIVQAPPHSISVTPSRESLSMTDTSVNTLKGIIKAVLKVMDVTSETFDARMAKVAERDIADDWLAGRAYKLVSMFGGEYYRQSMEKRAFPEYFNKLDQLAEYALVRNTGLSTKFFQRLSMMRLEALIHGGYRRKHALTQMLHILKYDADDSEYSYRRKNTLPFIKQVVRPIIKKLVKANLSAKSLYITVQQHSKAAIQGTEFINPLTTRIALEKQMELMSGVVIFTSSKTAYVEEYYSMGLVARTFTKARPNFVFVVPKKPEDRERARKTFEDMGFYVIDFYTHYQENCLVEAPVGPTIPSKPRPEGIPSLKNNLRPSVDSRGKPNGGFHFDRTGYRNPDGKRELIRIKEPELMFKAHKLSDRFSPKFFKWGDGYANFIVKYWGDRSGIVTNEPQWEKLLSLGVKPGEPIVFNEVLEYVENSPAIKTYYEEKNSGTSVILTHLRQIGHYSKIIRDIFPSVVELPEKDQEYLNFFTNVLVNELPHWEQSDKDDDKKVRALNKKLKAIPTSATIVACQEIVDKNGRLLNLLDLFEIERLLREFPNDRYAKTYAEISIINALKT